MEEAVAGSRKRAAGDDPLAIDDLAVGGYEGAIARVSRPQRERGSERVAEEDVGEEEPLEALVLRRALDDVDGADRPFGRGQLGRLGDEGQLLHLGERHERRASLRGLS